LESDPVFNQREEGDMARKLVVMIGLAAAAWAVSGPSAMAQSYDGTWRGKLNCDKLSFARGARSFPMILTVSANAASYARQVRDRAGELVGTEEGSGTVDPTGAISLTAKWTSGRPNLKFTYTATYRGRMHPSTAALRGTQVWVRGDQSESRRCRILLSR
jgi:hypothetical protein